MTSIYLDTNAFISAFESTGERSDEMWMVFDAIADGEFGGTTSEVTLAELLPKPLALGQTALAAFYEDMLSGRGAIRVVPVARVILVATATLRSRHSALKLADAIHLATAIDAGCLAMLSNDRRLPVPPTMRSVHLSSHSLADIRQILA